MSDPTIFIVDDDSAVRDSISMLLETMGHRHKTFADAQEFLAALEPEDAGVLILDVRMPGMSGLGLQAELNKRNRHLPIIFITGHGDVPMAVEAMKNGAVDFIRKPFRQQDLLDRIHEALQVEEKERGQHERLAENRANLETLSAREREVFGRVAAGQANKAIAIDLELSERTIEIHRSHVMSKMHARSLADLVRIQVSLEQADQESG